MPFQLQKPSLRWLAVNAKETVLLPDVLAEKTTYPAPIFASACQNDEDTQNKYETDDDDDSDDIKTP